MNASRNHARINMRPDGCYLEDLGSSNGTFMGSRQLNTPVKLTHRAEFKIGGTVFRFDEHESGFLGGKGPKAAPMPVPGPSKARPDEDFGANSFG